MKIKVIFEYNYKVPEKFMDVCKIFINSFKLRGFSIVQVGEVKEVPITTSNNFEEVVIE